LTIGICGLDYDIRYQPEVVDALVNACMEGEVANGVVRQLAASRTVELATTPSVELAA